MNSALETVSSNRSHGGIQGVYRHQSTATKTVMTFAVFIPDHPAGARLPVLWYLSGLTCTPANVTEKGDYRSACAEQGIIFIAPDTSPRGEDVADDPAYDFGQGAGFYLDAALAPWSAHFRMRTYIESELPAVIGAQFPMADLDRQGITGHSMGGHGALTIGLRDRTRFRSISAFAPICSPMECPWGVKALTGYLGEDRSLWRGYDACALIEDGALIEHAAEPRAGPRRLLIDQGCDDQFLADQLKPELLARACAAAGIELTLRMQRGYDHSYYFISTFLADHVRWHARHLKR